MGVVLIHSVPPDYSGVSSDSYRQRIFVETDGSLSPLKRGTRFDDPLTSCVRTLDRAEQFSKWYGKCQNRLTRTNVFDAQSGSRVR
jgi:hypothetical protein